MSEIPDSSKAYVFLGPTIPVEEATTELEAVYLPPAAQGDVYAAARERPWAIGLIDGYFERVPAVWHKEILWALSNGVHVFGSASMGALRAAELERFGMEGVGRVFEMFRDGVLEDDDEVTLVHSSVDTGYVKGSEAMVNIRVTLDAAASEVISGETRDTLIRIAKGFFYQRRTYDSIVASGAEMGLPKTELEALVAWLPEGRVDQKKADAIAMLRVMGAQAAQGVEPKRVSFAFQHTDAWEQVRSQINRRPLRAEAGADTQRPDALLEELRLRGTEFDEQWLQGMVWTFALELAQRDGVDVDTDVVEAATEKLLVSQGLQEPDEITQWLSRQHLKPEEFARLMVDEARVGRLQSIMESEVARNLRDRLRLSGRYEKLEERARSKQNVLASRGLDIPSLEDAGMSEDELWRWYFEDRLDVPVPANMGAYARNLHFLNVDALRQAVLREYCFVRLERGMNTVERTELKC